MVDGDSTKQGKLNILDPTTVKLKDGIAENVWYRSVMTVDPAVPRVTGKVFKHTVPRDPNSPLELQVGGTLTYEPSVLPSGVSPTGQSGLLAHAVNAVVDLSITNFSNQPELCIPAPPECNTSSAPGCALRDGEPQAGVSGGLGSQRYYFVDVPAGVSNLKIQISGGTGDVDLYVRSGAVPTLSAYQCRPYLTGTSESCTFPSPTVGRYYTMLSGYAAYSGVTILADY